jgi:hypothetical protein
MINAKSSRAAETERRAVIRRRVAVPTIRRVVALTRSKAAVLIRTRVAVLERNQAEMAARIATEAVTARVYIEGEEEF